MLENLIVLVIFDTCDVVSNWSISPLPPIVLDNLFAFTRIPVYSQIQLHQATQRYTGFYYQYFPKLSSRIIDTFRDALGSINSLLE